MSSADLVHLKGFGSALWASMKAVMASSSSRVERWGAALDLAEVVGHQACTELVPPSSWMEVRCYGGYKASLAGESQTICKHLINLLSLNWANRSPIGRPYRQIRI